MNELTDAYRKPNKAPGTKNFSDKIKLEAVKLWLATGSPTIVGTTLGVKVRTIHLWMTQNWWKRVVEDVQTEGKFKLNAKLRDIVDQSMFLLTDRLNKGDFHYDHELKEFVRKPLKATDIHRIASDFIDKTQKFEEQPKDTKRTEDYLAQLANAFSTFVSKTSRVEVIDAVPNERETGLQERILLGTTPQRAGTPESEEDESQTIGTEDGESEERRSAPSRSHKATQSWRQQLQPEPESDIETSE